MEACAHGSIDVLEKLKLDGAKEDLAAALARAAYWRTQKALLDFEVHRVKRDDKLGEYYNDKRSW